jgi:hypothetical protein
MNIKSLRFLSCLFLLSFFGIDNVNAQTDASLLFAKGIGNEYLAGGNLNIQNIKIDASGNRYVVGNFSATADFDPSAGTANLTSAGGSDIFIAKYNSSGDYVWAKRIGGTGADQGNSLTLDGSGNVFLTGYFAGTVDFDPSASTANLISAGGNDIFIAKYNSSGDYVWANGIGGTGIDRGLSPYFGWERQCGGNGLFSTYSRF